MGMETALLFCAIRAAETLGTLAFSRDTRAAYETTLCLKLEELNPGLLTLCLTSPALLYFDATLNPAHFGSVGVAIWPRSRKRSLKSETKFRLG